MNITISVDEETVEKARDHARCEGRSLQDLIREYLQRLVGERSHDDVADELRELLTQHGGHSGGYRFRRADIYKDRV